MTTDKENRLHPGIIFSKFAAMIIFNTTYSVSAVEEARFMSWLRDDYIPDATRSGELTLPQLTKIMAQEEGSDSHSYSLQFHASSVGVLNGWYEATGRAKAEEIMRKFGDKVVGFHTVMEIMEL